MDLSLGTVLDRCIAIPDPAIQSGKVVDVRGLMAALSASVPPGGTA